MFGAWLGDPNIGMSGTKVGHSPSVRQAGRKGASDFVPDDPSVGTEGVAMVVVWFGHGDICVYNRLNLYFKIIRIIRAPRAAAFRTLPV